MTCYLYHEGRYYADSLFMKGDDQFQSLTKIVRLDVPFPIKVKGDKKNELPIMDDVIHGWFGTGVVKCMERFIGGLETFPGEKAHIALTAYRMAAAAHLINELNNFEIILIGRKADHRFEFYANYFEYSTYQKDISYALGGGGPLALNHLKGHGDPIRAILETSIADANSGGMIDVWALESPSKSDPEFRTFRRVGMHDAIPSKMVHAYLSNFDPLKEMVPLTFQRRKTVMNELLAEIDKMDKVSKTPAVKKVAAKKAVAKPLLKPIPKPRRTAK